MHRSATTIAAASVILQGYSSDPTVARAAPRISEEAARIMGEIGAVSETLDRAVRAMAERCKVP
jgi:hypothetical protein